MSMIKKKDTQESPIHLRVLKDLADDIGYDNIETVIEKETLNISQTLISKIDSSIYKMD